VRLIDVQIKHFKQRRVAEWDKEQLLKKQEAALRADADRAGKS